MRTPLRVRFALVFAAGLVTGPLAFWAFRVHAREGEARPVRGTGLSELLTLMHTGFGGFGAGQEAERRPSGVVHVIRPVTAGAAKTWVKLQRVVDAHFANETPLEDFLKFLQYPAGPNDKERAFSIYVDPVGLQEVEKTMTSPITLDLKDIPAATALTLALKQLGLMFSVQDDGLVMITNEDSDKVVGDPSARILDELAAIRDELAELRRDVLITKPAPGHGQGSEFNKILQELNELREKAGPQGGARNPAK